MPQGGKDIQGQERACEILVRQVGRGKQKA